MNTPDRSVLTPTKQRSINTPVFSPNSKALIKAAQTDVSTKNITSSRLRPSTVMKKIIKHIKKSAEQDRADKENNRASKIADEVEERQDEDFAPAVKRVSKKKQAAAAVANVEEEEEEEDTAEPTESWTREEIQSAPMTTIRLDENDNLAPPSAVKKPIVEVVKLDAVEVVKMPVVEVVKNPVVEVAAVSDIVVDIAPPTVSPYASLPAEKEAACFSGLRSTMRCTIS